MARTQQITSIKVDAPPVGGRVDGVNERPEDRLDQPGREAEVRAVAAARVQIPERLRELVEPQHAQPRRRRSPVPLGRTERVPRDGVAPARVELRVGVLLSRAVACVEIKFRTPHAIDATLSPWPHRLDGVEVHEGHRA